VRTTINLPDDLLAEAKRAAASSGRTLTQFVEDAIRAGLARRQVRHQELRSLPTAPGSPRPGVDLDDSAALLQLMDADDPL
jgi:Arc/MetJ family transcription regulator